MYCPGKIMLELFDMVISKLDCEEFNFIDKLFRRKGAYRITAAVACVRLTKSRVENVKKEIRMNSL
jgi:hypothetical protein